MTQQAKTEKPAVKICGVTVATDVAHCCHRGVDFVGFNFYRGSKRLIQPERAASLWRDAGPQSLASVVTRAVAVVVDHGPDEIAAALQLFPEITAVQVHRALDAAEIAAFRARLGGRELWMAIPLKDASGFSSAQAVAASTDLILFDSAHVPVGAAVAGGSGQVFDWSYLKGYHANYRYGVAGGVSASNLPLLASLCRPDLVDICSGVESAPGRKDAAKIDDVLKLVGNLW